MYKGSSIRKRFHCLTIFNVILALLIVHAYLYHIIDFQFNNKVIAIKFIGLLCFSIFLIFMDHLIKPLVSYLDRIHSREKVDNVDLASALKVILIAPQASFIIIGIWWFIVYSMSMLAMVFIYSYTWKDIWPVTLVGFFSGVLFTLFQYYITKFIFMPAMVDLPVTKEALDLISKEPVYTNLLKFIPFSRTIFDLEKKEVSLSIRRKLLVSFLSVSSVFLVMMGIMVFQYVPNIFHETISLSLMAETEKEARLLQDLSEGEFETIKRKGDLYPSYVFSRDGKVILGKDSSGVPGEILEDARYIVSPSVRRVDNRIFAIVPIEGKELLIAKASDDISRSRGIMRMNRIYLMVAFVGLMTIAIISVMVASETSSSIRSLMVSVEKIAKGNLKEEVRVISEDEVGFLASRIRVMRGNLAEMINMTAISAAKVEESSKDIMSDAKEVADRSKTQALLADDVASCMEQTKKAVGDVTSGIQWLNNLSQGTNQSVNRMSSSVKEVVSRAEDLAISVDQTSSSIAEITASLKEVSERVDKLRENAQNVATSMMEMDAAIKEIKARAVEAQKFMEEMMEYSKIGVNAVLKTISGMEAIKYTSSDASSALDHLEKSVGRIGKILEVIEDIADRTHLISINAAIIAAQSGEHGRAFSVLAEEVRSLSESTVSSTKEIGQIIKELRERAMETTEAMRRSLEKIDESMKKSSEIGESLKGILDRSEKVSEMVSDITRSTVEQSEASGNVTRSIENVSLMVEEIARTIKEQFIGSQQIVAASEEMRDISRNVKEITGRHELESRNVMESIERFNETLHYINSLIKEQESALSKAMDRIEKIRVAAHENASRVEHVEQSVKSLFDEAEVLRERIRNFIC